LKLKHLTFVILACAFVLVPLTAVKAQVSGQAGPLDGAWQVTSHITWISNGEVSPVKEHHVDSLTIYDFPNSVGYLSDAIHLFPGIWLHTDFWNLLVIRSNNAVTIMTNPCYYSDQHLLISGTFATNKKGVVKKFVVKGTGYDAATKRTFQMTLVFRREKTP